MPLKVSDGIGAYIDDFQKSDAPQFKGKDKKERRDMAIAAYLTAKRGGKAQDENVKSADRKPEVYTKPDGKKGVRMVATDREVVKAEAYTMGKPIEKKKTEALDAKDKPFVKDLVKKLRGGSKTHAKQADDLEKAMNTEALKVGSTVKPTKGPHAGHPHEVIHDFGNGHYNIKPKNMSPSRNKYRMGATKAHKDDLKTESVMTSIRMRSRPKGESARDDRLAALKKQHDRQKKQDDANLSKLRYARGMKEAMNFAVSIEGLPTMFMSADSPGMLKQTLRKIVKQPSMIQSVKRVTDAKVKKTFRLKAQGKEEESEE